MHKDTILEQQKQPPATDRVAGRVTFALSGGNDGSLLWIDGN
jgi:hypothetical protein